MGTGGSRLNKLRANFKLAANQWSINKALVVRQHEVVAREQSDRILYNGKSTYSIIWGLESGGGHILLSPVPFVHYVRHHAHVAFNADLGPFINRLTYALADFGTIMTVWISARWLGLSNEVSLRQLRRALSSNKAIYTISPSLFPRPDYWPENLQVLGFHPMSTPVNWRPEKELRAFLEAHKEDRVLFISFGSMTNPEPAAKPRVFFEILERNKIPAIIGIGSGGLRASDAFQSEHIYFVPRIPYEWIFSRVCAVIHHGGSGTTHMALRHACPSMAIPHVADQFSWASIIHEMGVGPKGIRIDRINVGELEPKILELMANGSYKVKAEQVADQMGQEHFRERICSSIIER
jgi:UDP:flavonoid glycosyltransferase YjiC (YdhE family)